jgi:four helix bundle protein
MSAGAVSMNEQEFMRRTKRFALDVITSGEELPRCMTTQVLGKQLLRCATSVGANYRAACRAKSPADMIVKLGIVEEEADESIYWLELLIESNLTTTERASSLLKEANEITAMIVASKKTLKMRV